MDQDVGVIQFRQHLFRIGDEIRRQVAAIELHAFDDIQLGLQSLGFLDGNHAFIADGLHRTRDHIADFFLAIRRDRADLRDFLAGLDLLGPFPDFSGHGLHGHVDAALQVHRVHAGGNGLRTFANDRLGEHGCRCRAVTGDVIGLARDFAHHLGAHVFELVRKFDFLRDGHAVLGDAWRTERLVDHDIPAFGAERYLDGIRKNIDAAQHSVAGIRRKFHIFSSHN